MLCFTFEMAAKTLVILTQKNKQYSSGQIVFALSLCAACQKKATMMQGLKALTG